MKPWTPWLRTGLVFGSGIVLGFALASWMAWYRPSDCADQQMAKVRRVVAELEARRGGEGSMEAVEAEVQALLQSRQARAAACSEAEAVPP